MATKKPKIVIYASEELAQKLKELAEKEHRSVSNYCELKLSEMIEEMEKEKTS